jgi:uncharacterized protein with HEPN domain
MNERDEKLLLKIKNEAEYLVEVLEEGDLNSFLKNRGLQYIVSMALIKIGEYVKSLSKDFKQEHCDIEWREIAGFRDIAVQNYDGLNMERIFVDAMNDVPELLEKVNDILNTEK